MWTLKSWPSYVSIGYLTILFAAVAADSLLRLPLR
jgi:hypothetical protein